MTRAVFSASHITKVGAKWRVLRHWMVDDHSHL